MVERVIDNYWLWDLVDVKVMCDGEVGEEV